MTLKNDEPVRDTTPWPTALRDVPAVNTTGTVAPLPAHLCWRGKGPPPASWYAPCGTKVYRSYEDYCDD